MISAASNIKSVTEELKKMPVRHLFDAVRNPREQTKVLLRNLQLCRQIDASKYSSLKQQLPYFVCAMFNPPYRRTENFAYTEYFIVDIDHLSDKQLVSSEVRKKLEADPRTMLCFLSPSGDGLKVLFKLSERCYDAGLYKMFYKLFVHKFSVKYALEQVVDTRTCDVTRACFLSADSEAYFNPEPELVVVDDYIKTDDVAVNIGMMRETEKKEHKKGTFTTTEKNPEPTDDVLAQIRSTLNMQSRKPRCKQEAYVPNELNDIMDDLKAYVEAKGVTLSEIVNIQYGKKLRFILGHKQAEINLFFGKRGFTVVQSPRTGTDKEANALMADVINCFLEDNFFK